MSVYQRSVLRTSDQDLVCREFFSLRMTGKTHRCMNCQIDRVNLEGYLNLDHWVAELDKRIEGILLQHLVHIIKVWCSEFDRVDDGDTRRDVPVRNTSSKRRGDKRAKEEKVRFGVLLCGR